MGLLPERKIVYGCEKREIEEISHSFFPNVTLL